MRVVNLQLENFGSYEKLEFSFDRGLILIQGPTGAGKSTLCDAIPWILFGKTAKGGAVDEVRSWAATEPTKGIVWLQDITVSRTRGAAKDNDLVFWPTGGEPTRGKDMADTQRLLNQRLGFDLSLYLAGAYYHEFSQTAQFFTASANVRRMICEQLVDLSLATKLTARLKDELRSLKKQQAESAENIAKHKTEVETCRRLEEEAKRNSKDWERLYTAEIKELTAKSKNFDAAKRSAIKKLQHESDAWADARKEEVKELNQAIATARADIRPDDELLYEERRLAEAKLLAGELTCPTCGGPAHPEERERLVRWEIQLDTKRRLSQQRTADVEKIERQLKQALSQINPFATRVTAEEARENTYDEQIASLKRQTNPHRARTAGYRANRLDASMELADAEASLVKIEGIVADYDVLSDITASYRSASIQYTIEAVQARTNALLADYFDGEMRVEFSADDTNLDVSITKDGNEATYTQLSKGQRCMLKLCFGLSVMKTVAERHAVKFEQVFLDEALDGLDEAFKTKAYRMLEALALEHESVYVVEHSEGLKALFENKLTAELVDGRSQLCRS